MHIAIFGANSQIAKDLTRSLVADTDCTLGLFLRDKNKLDASGLTLAEQRRINVFEYAEFNTKTHFDAIINFVGIGDPALAVKMGSAIFEVTYEYDKLALDYLKINNKCRYLFLSSGAAYGCNFDAPVNAQSLALFDLNNLKATDWYAVAKFYAEARHRTYTDHNIVDVRVFNYFSRSQDLSARYFITDALRAIHENTVLTTSALNIYRDYITPVDFYGLIVNTLRFSGDINLAVDCYTKGSTDKFSILNHLHENFGLQFTVEGASPALNATGTKQHYYSENKVAATLGYRPHFNSLDGLTHEIERSQLFK
ncbi:MULTISPECIES: NAD-dependent epimerase/dehydratase family protein [Pseudomonas]|jgi:nucleoside-diphosphate-sugar epimerase|uniref:NAD-dependent epimerase/dehydratase family protein n=1 Tax=Pseudomonas TaxID=286 RepID=UPI002402AE39|nr:MULTISPECIES: NAD-dependent epimerase/dehydratase family protein [unclassified Pseudomonas]WEX17573.1 NAD-dependent epimerase/dehydratase family protein [Pseudomonas sp. G11]WLD68448.1 NAD-dependent epimerase/dehydratase family protein [Pseudomonas sp. OVF7]